MPYPRDVTFKNARIIYRNFQGRKTKFSPEGRRTFHVLLPIDVAKQMADDGWNIKWPKPNEDGTPSDLLPHTEIIVAFDNRPPKIYMITSNNKQLLNERRIEALDSAEIEKLDMVISPYNWEVNGRRGIKGYLRTMVVHIHEDELEKEYSDAPVYDEPFDGDGS